MPPHARGVKAFEMQTAAEQPGGSYGAEAAAIQHQQSIRNQPEPVAEMSRSELSARLVQSLHRTGVADKLKSQLRAKLYAELHLRSDTLHKRNAEAVPMLYCSKSLIVCLSDIFGNVGWTLLSLCSLPEAGIVHLQEILDDTDILHALHLDRPCATLRQMMHTVVDNRQADSLLSCLLAGLSHISDIQQTDKEMQTNTDLEDILSAKIDQVEKSLLQGRKESGQLHFRVIEDRLFQYQKQLESQMQQDIKDQLQKFRELELAQMRIDERNNYKAMLSRQKSDFEQKLLENQEGHIITLENERKRIAEQEQSYNGQNLLLRQRLLDESNRTMMKEAQLRNEAELHTKEIQLERDMLQRRVEEVQLQLTELQSFKERYTQKLESSIAQYKIDLNKEHTTIMSGLRVDRVRIDAELLQLKERAIVVEKMHAAVHCVETERDSLKLEIKNIHNTMESLAREKDDAILQAKELQLELLTHRGSSALEFEISSLKKQLIESEKTSDRRQEEYQVLIKSLITPKDDLREELSKSRTTEAKWQRECQRLVTNLDLELNRSEELQRQLDDNVLKNRELHRELADTRLLLHQAQSALTTELAQHPTFQPPHTPRMLVYPRRDMLPDPFDPYLDEMYSKISKRMSIESPHERNHVYPNHIHDEFNNNSENHDMACVNMREIDNKGISFYSSRLLEENERGVGMNTMLPQVDAQLPPFVNPYQFTSSTDHEVIQAPPITTNSMHPSAGSDYKTPPSQVPAELLMKGEHLEHRVGLTEKIPADKTPILPQKSKSQGYFDTMTNYVPRKPVHEVCVSPPSTLMTGDATVTATKQRQTEIVSNTISGAIEAPIQLHSPFPAPPDTTKAMAEEDSEQCERAVEDRRLREEHRRRDEQAKRDAIEREKIQLAQQEEKQHQQSLLDQQKVEEEKQRALHRQLEREELERENHRHHEKKLQDAAITKKDDVIANMENDPVMQRYMALVKERRSQQEKIGNSVPLHAPSNPKTFEKAQTSLESALSSSSDMFCGTGNTDDEVSAPNDDTSESPSW
ncbi:hypothetical protein BASA60_007791 [Batrachochytrium salamandrivorans]|nr:hypothetical protein BASA60_007791 [Batrachochytrium salamandrivorans]